MIDKMSNWDFGYPHAIYDMFAGVYQASSVFYADRRRWFAYVSCCTYIHLRWHCMFTTDCHLCNLNISKDEIFCWVHRTQSMCIWNLANLDTSTAKKIWAHTKQQKAKTNLIAIGVIFTLKRNRIIEWKLWTTKYMFTKNKKQTSGVT